MMISQKLLKETSIPSFGEVTAFFANILIEKCGDNVSCFLDGDMNWIDNK
jgi:hypothetical protein